MPEVIRRADNLNFLLEVKIEDAGLRLDKFISTNLSQFSRSDIQRIIKSGAVIAGGRKIIDNSHKVKPGETFEIFAPERKEVRMLPADIALNIVYEDDFLLVIDKQAGLTTHPGAGNYSDTLANALINHCKGCLSNVGGAERPGIVHRLDKDTSGLMVVAKTDKSHRILASQIKNRELVRVYNAVTWGAPSPPAGKIEINIGRSSRDRKKMTVLQEGGKKAVTHYKVIETFGQGASLVECRLETGRTHQIRVHMAYKGSPVIGDKAYGTKRNYTISWLSEEGDDYIRNFPRQALHSKYIGFSHPESGEWLEFSSPVNNESKTAGDISRILDFLRNKSREAISS